jgi:hypothetical protein
MLITLGIAVIVYSVWLRLVKLVFLRPDETQLGRTCTTGDNRFKRGIEFYIGPRFHALGWQMVDKPRSGIGAGGHKYREPAVAMAAGDYGGGAHRILGAIELHHSDLTFCKRGVAIGTEHLLNDVTN